MSYTAETPGNNSQSYEHVEKSVLIREASTDPRDPLHWSLRRRLGILFALSLSAFTGLASSTTLLSGLVVQAQTYHVTPTQMSYSVSALVAGLMVGPILAVPISKAIGPSSVIFWSLVGLLITSIWSAKMTRSDQYISFVISRLIGGLFGANPQVLGNSVLLDTFHLHERGRAFAVYATSFVLGPVVGPTLSGFVVSHTNWPVQFWWTVGLEAFALIICFCLLEETGFVRNGLSSLDPVGDQSWMASRVATFFFGQAVMPKMTALQVLKAGVDPFSISIKPVTICCALYEMIAYGFMVIVQTLLAIFLQEPYLPEHGLYGYSFSPQQNALFIFFLWAGMLLAQLYGLLVNDRLPLYVATRAGHWYSEYRLHSLWLPGLITLPLAYGLFGASLQYHLHWAVLGVASLFVAFTGAASAPVPINYLAESYDRNPQDVGTVLNFFRILPGLVVPFFIDAWEAKVGVGWVFGMAAFFGAGTFALIVMVMFLGPKIRGAAPLALAVR